MRWTDSKARSLDSPCQRGGNRSGTQVAPPQPCSGHTLLFATLIGERRLQQSSASNPRFDLEADQNDRTSRMSPFHSHFSPTHQGKERQMLLSNGESRQCATLSPDIRNSAPLNDTYWPGLPLPCPPRYQSNVAPGPKSEALNGVGCRPRVVT